MENKTGYLITICIGLMIWIFPFNDILALVSNNPIQMKIQDSFYENFRYQHVTIENKGWHSVSSIVVKVDSIGKLGENISNSCIDATIEYGKFQGDATIKLVTMEPNYLCTIVFKSLPDNEIYSGMIVGNNLSEYEWSRSGQYFEPFYKILGIVIVILIGVCIYQAFKIIRKEDVTLSSLVPTSLNDLEREFGYVFSNEDTDVINTIRNGNFSVTSISKYLGKPKSYIRRKLEFLEKTGVVYWDY